MSFLVKILLLLFLIFFGKILKEKEIILFYRKKSEMSSLKVKNINYKEFSKSKKIGRPKKVEKSETPEYSDDYEEVEEVNGIYVSKKKKDKDKDKEKNKDKSKDKAKAKEKVKEKDDGNLLKNKLLKRDIKFEDKMKDFNKFLLDISNKHRNKLLELKQALYKSINIIDNINNPPPFDNDNSSNEEETEESDNNCDYYDATDDVNDNANNDISDQKEYLGRSLIEINKKYNELQDIFIESQRYFKSKF